MRGLSCLWPHLSLLTPWLATLFLPRSVNSLELILSVAAVVSLAPTVLLLAADLSLARKVVYVFSLVAANASVNCYRAMPWLALRGGPDALFACVFLIGGAVWVGLMVSVVMASLRERPSRDPRGSFFY